MRNLVIELANYARLLKPGFLIVPQNGLPVMTSDGSPTGTVVTDFVNTIDAWGVENFLYGAQADNVFSTEDLIASVVPFMNQVRSLNKPILVTDYCSDPAKMYGSYVANRNFFGFNSFAADNRQLSNVPSYPSTPFNVNNLNVDSLPDAKNFLNLINPLVFGEPSNFVQKMRETNFDLLIIDPVINRNTILTSSQIQQLKTKANGGRRRVLCYISVGEAETNRAYWNPAWTPCTGFLERENPLSPGNYKVKYWDPAWKAIIYGNPGSYIKSLVDAGCDGAYLDIINAFNYFESDPNKCPV